MFAIGIHRARRTVLSAAVATTLAAAAAGAVLLAADAKPVGVNAVAAPAAGSYATDFSKMPVGKPTGDELFILNGAFVVADAGGGDHVLELPGNPVDTFGVLFGPEGQTATEVAARVHGTSVGKMFPEFGVGSNDSGGWKVWVLPGQNAVVLRKKEDEVARASFTWASGTWTHLKLRVAPAGDGKWKVDGKVWAGGTKEPEAWTVSTTDAAAPPAGRASVWGQPYAGTPIRFDDLSVGPAK